MSSTAAINHGDGVQVYEAVYGATHEAVPPDTANPLPLILPAIELLKDLGETTAAERIQQGGRSGADGGQGPHRATSAGREHERVHGGDRREVCEGFHAVVANSCFGCCLGHCHGC